MAVCAFLGTHIYDLGIAWKIGDAIDGIVRENRVTEFLLYNDCGGFFDACLNAVVRAKVRYPQSVTITFVLHNIPKALPHQPYAPYCAADRIIAPIPNLEAGVKGRKRLQRWILERSTHIIWYQYELLGGVDQSMIRFVKRSPALQVIDICDPETAKVVREESGRLTETEQLLLGADTGEALSAVLGVSRTRVWQIQQKAASKLRKYAATRVQEMAAQRGRRPLVCGMFNLGDATHETLGFFAQAVDYLTERYRITRFEIEGRCCRSAFMRILRRSSKRREIHITAVVSDADLTEAGDGDIMEHICPPCNAVLNVDTTLSGELGVIAEMMDRSVFCICNLTASPADEEIRRIARASRTMLLDIGKKPVGLNL